jgi:hypothetical protein
MLGVAALALLLGAAVHREQAWCLWYRAIADYQSELAESCPLGEECNMDHALISQRARLKSRSWSAGRAWGWPPRHSALAASSEGSESRR